MKKSRLIIRNSCALCNFGCARIPRIGLLRIPPASLPMNLDTEAFFRSAFHQIRRHFDPTYSVQFTERQVLYVIYNTLVSYGTDL